MQRYVELDIEYKYHPERVTELMQDPDPELVVPPPAALELYNIDEDPLEQENLAERETQRVAHMLNELENWFEEVEAERRRIRYHRQWLELTRYEYLILSTLLRHPEHVLSRDQLMEAVWADPGASLDRVIDTHIKGIRTKLKRILPSHDPIVTHRGLGYSINPQLPGADG